MWEESVEQITWNMKSFLKTGQIKPRPVGLARGVLSVPAAFFEPLPDEVVDGFEGHRE